MSAENSGKPLGGSLKNHLNVLSVSIETNKVAFFLDRFLSELLVIIKNRKVKPR